MPPFNSKDRQKRPLPVVELLESRILYSADAIGALAPFLVDDESALEMDALSSNVDVVLLNDAANSPSDDEYLENTFISADILSTETESRRIVFIDHSVPRADLLVDAMVDQNTHIFYIAQDDNGIQEISDTLAQFENVSAVEIYSHGSSGQLQLGNTRVDQHYLTDNRHLISDWAAALTDNANIYLLGCDVADGVEGELFVDTLAALTNADLAASSDITGHSTKGGDWDLEYKVGQIERDIQFDANKLEEWDYSLLEITPDNLLDEFNIPLGTEMAELIQLQNNGTTVSLREAVYAAQQGAASADTIRLLGETYVLSLTGTDNDGLVGDLDVADDLSIIGTGSGSSVIHNDVSGSRIIDVNNPVTFTLSGITLEDGDENSGGGSIYATAGSDVFLDDVHITNSESGNRGGAITAWGNLAINNSSFSNNTSGWSGGAIFNGGALSISNSTFELNESGTDTSGGDPAGGKGGAISGVDVFLNNTDFTGNIADGDGGALYAEKTLSITGVSTWHGNIAGPNAGLVGSNGGAIAAQGTYNITDANFSENVSSFNGGAVYGIGAGDINSSSFTLNQTRLNGGAVFTADSYIITDSEFSENRAFLANGGAVLGVGAGNITDSTFTLNTGLGRGGAVYAAAEYVIVDSTFTSNNANAFTGGGVHGVGVGTLNSSTFTQNYSKLDGGAFYAEAHVTIVDSDFGSNISLDDGGALYAKADVTIADSDFSSNSAGNDGGAIVVESDLVNLEGSRFYKNTSGNDGGAIMAHKNITVNSSSFEENSASDNAGAIANVDAGVIDVYNSTFYNNSAMAGGAIVSEENGSIIQSTFVGNTATNQAAAIWADGGSVSIQGSLFSENILGASASGALGGNVVSTGFNLFDYNHTGTIATDLNNTDPLLNVWQDPVAAGSVTNTIVAAYTLSAGSPAINAGTVEDSNAVDSQANLRDQVSDIGASEVDSNASIVFWNDDTGDIYRSNIDFSNVQLIVASGTDPAGLAVDEANSNIYWIDQNNNDLNYASMDGVGGVFNLISGSLLSNARALAIDSAAAHLYVAFTGSNARIDRYSLASGQEGTLLETVIASDIEDPQDIEVSAALSRLFWVEANSNASGVVPSVNSLDLQGGNRTSVAADNVGTLSADPSIVNWAQPYLYWSNLEDDSLTRQSLLNNVSQNFDTSPNSAPGAIAFDESSRHLVWASNDTNQISTLSADFETIENTHQHDELIQDMQIMSTSTTTQPPELYTLSSLYVSEGQLDSLISTGQLQATDAETLDDELVFTVTRLPQYGTLTVDGIDNTNSFTQEQVNDGLVLYSHDGSETTSDSIMLTLSDLTHTTGEFPLNIQVTPVNDPPIFTVRTPIAINESERYTFVLADFTVDDPDDDVANMHYRYHNDLVYGDIYVNDYVLEKNHHFSHQHLLNGQVTYLHNGSESGNETINFVLASGTGDSPETPMTIEVVEVNDTPTLTTVSVVNIAENASHIFSVSDLVVVDDDNLTADYRYRHQSALVTGTLTVDGTVLNATDEFTHQDLVDGKVIYQHNGDETFAETIDFLVSDGQVDSAVSQLGISISAVNDAPTLTTGSAVTIAENASHVFTVSDLVVADDDNQDADYRYRYQSALVTGTLIVDGTALNANDEFTHQDLVDGKVVYQHNGDETFAEDIDFIVSDGIVDSAVSQLSISISAVNDAPTLTTANLVSITENASHIFNVSDLVVVDDDNLEADYRYRYESALVTGKLTVDGTVLNATDEFTHQDLVDGKVIYQHNGDETFAETIDFLVSDGQVDSAVSQLSIVISSVNDAPILTATSVVNIAENESYVFTVSDLVVVDDDNLDADYRYRYESALVTGTLTVDGTVLNATDEFTHQDLVDGKVIYQHSGDETFAEDIEFIVSDGIVDSALSQLSIVISSVNDAPILTANSVVNIAENENYVFTVSDLVVVDDDNLDADYRYRYQSALVTGTLTVDGTVLNATDKFTHQDLVDGKVIYQHNGDETFAETIDFIVSDGQVDSAVSQLSIVISAVNDAPALTAGSAVTIAESASHVLTVSDLVVADDDNQAADYRYRYLSTLNTGVLIVERNVLSTNDEFTHQDLVDGKVVYRHSGDEVFAENIDFVVSDGQADSTVSQLSISISAVNDAPMLTTGSAVTIVENASHVFTVSDLVVTDDDNQVADYRYRYQSALVTGILSVDGTDLKAGDEFTHQELVDGKVVYQHNGDEIIAENIDFIVSDGQADSTVSQVNIAIIGVNDAPTLTTVTTVTMDENAFHVFSVSDLVAADVDNESSDFQYQYVSALTTGSIEVDGKELLPGEQFSHEQLVNQQVIYRHDGDEIYQETIDFRVSDGSSFSNTSSLFIDIVNQNDTAVLLVPDMPVSLNEGDSYVFGIDDLKATDAETSNENLLFSYTTPPSAGVMLLNGSPLEINAEFTHAQLVAGELAYEHDGGEGLNDVVTFIVSDGITDSPEAAFAISLQPVNDTPEIVFTGLDIPENQPGALAGTVQIVDEDIGDTANITVDDDRFTVVQGQLELKDGVALNYEQEPEVNLRVTATDDANAASFVDVNLQVLDLNDKPEATEAPAIVKENNYALPEALFIDSDGDLLSYSVSMQDGDPIPDWLGFNADDQSFYVIDEESVVSSLDVLVIAEDGRGGRSSVVVTLYFEPPVASALPALPLESILQELPSGLVNQPVVVQEFEQTTTVIETVATKEAEFVEEDSTLEIEDAVDLHSLIKPLSSFGSLEFAEVGSNTRVSADGKTLGIGISDVDTYDLSDLLSLPSSEFTDFSETVSRDMDTSKEELLKQATLSSAFVGGSAGITTGLSVGYLLWLIRGGALMSSMLSSLPAWRFVDPLPVLGSLGDGMDDDDESLASMVESQKDEQEAKDPDEKIVEKDGSDRV